MDEKLSEETDKKVRPDPWTILEWALLLIALALFTVTETYQLFVTAGLGLLAVFFVERGIRGRLAAVQTGLEIPLLLFVISGAVGTVIAYNQSAALLQFARILGAVALFYALVDSQAPIPEIVTTGLVIAAAGLAIYWPLSNDFFAQPGKLDGITQIGQWLNARFATPPGPQIHNNVAGGVLLVSYPYGIALAGLSWRARRTGLAIGAGLLSAVILFGLWMTSSRGAWAGLVGMGLAFGLALAQRRWFPGKRTKITFWSAVAVLCLACVWGIQASGRLDQLLGQIPGPTGALRVRSSLWQEGWGLLQDYPFTGSGLQTYWMVHAVYAILIHTPYIAHSHNSFLQIWIEQGFLGALSLVWGSIVVLGWAWFATGREKVPLLGVAGLAALCGAAIHGIVDVVFYIERTLPLVGLLLGTAALARPPANAFRRQPSKNRRWLAYTGFGLGLLLLVGAIYYRPLAAAWQANLGALKQTRIELGFYDPVQYQEISLDQIRQRADLSSAQADLQRAIALQPTNRTALQRLAMIALARGEYENALNWMQIAWNSGQRDQATRLLYSDALAANGQPEMAAKLVENLPQAEGRLLGQALMRYWNNRDYRRAADAWTAALSLNPTNQQIEEWLEQASQHLNP